MRAYSGRLTIIDLCELDETQELYYPAIMRAKVATDYAGYVGQEFSHRNSADWARSLEAAYRVCDVLGPGFVG